MPTFRTGNVTRIASERDGIQHVDVDGEPAVVYSKVIGPVAVGDRVVMNTTAVDLGLGTGGRHVVHWNLARDHWDPPPTGHIMKLRYTSAQMEVTAGEETLGDTFPDLAGVPVVACGLHSQIGPVAAAFKHLAPSARLAYLMTDGGALPLPLSNLVVELRDAGLMDATVTAGHAFGGDHEAVNVFGALQVAVGVARADAIVAGIGPGVVGTASALGHTGLDVVTIASAARAVGATPIVAIRFSEADDRDRHQGVSHHTRTALQILGEVLAPLPDSDTPDAAELLHARGIEVTTMGRGADTEPGFFRYAAAAGALAARMLTESGGTLARR